MKKILYCENCILPNTRPNLFQIVSTYSVVSVNHLKIKRIKLIAEKK